MPTCPPSMTFFLDDDAAGKPGLRGDHYVFSNLAIVADVHKIVDFGAASNACDLQRSPVDGCVGADFNIISDFKPPNLREFFIVARCLLANVAETVAAQYRPGMNYHPIAKMAAGIDGDIGIELAIAANTDIRANHNPGANPGAIADLRRCCR